MSTKPIVYVQECDYLKVDEIVDNIFKKFPLQVKGKLVWVKPNMLGDFIPGRQVTTHPAIISAIVKKLLSLSAKVVVGDNSGVQSMLSDLTVASKSGLLEASGESFRNISKEVVYKTIGAPFNETVAVSKIVDDCDILISVPKMKTHLQTFITGGVKNSYGFIVGKQKPQLHLKYPGFREFSELVAEIYNLRKPDLVIMDAVYAIEGDGPNSPHIRAVNKVIACPDAVALDCYVAGIMGMDIGKIPLLKYCQKRQFGASNWRLEGTDTGVISDFKLPKTYSARPKKNSFLVSWVLKFIINKRIIVDRKKCSMCKKCFNVCPANAISWNKGPRIDYKKCILCFCCREICEKEAVVFARKYVYTQKVVKWINAFFDKRLQARH